MRLQFLHDSNRISLEIERDGPAWRVRLPDGTDRSILVTVDGDHTLRIEERIDSEERIEGPVAGQQALDKSIERPEPPSSPVRPVNMFIVPIIALDDGWHVSYGGMTYRFQPDSGRPSRDKAKASSGLLTAPMSGIVADLLAKVGDRVEAYQPLAVIEAMKIMATLEAPFAGTVTAIHARAKQQVAHGAPVIEIAPLEEAS